MNRSNHSSEDNCVATLRNLNSLRSKLDDSIYHVGKFSLLDQTRKTAPIPSHPYKSRTHA